MKKKFWKNPIVAIISLIIGIVLFGIPYLIPTQFHSGIFSEYLEMPVLMEKSPSGRTAICDDKGVIFVFNQAGDKIDYMIEYSDLEGNSTFSEMVFGENDHLFISYADYSKTSNRILKEGIIEFDEQGKQVREICEYNYQYRIGKPIRYAQIKGLNVEGNQLRYLCTNEEDAVLVSTDLNSLISVEEATYKSENYNNPLWADALDDGSYVVAVSNGDIGKIYLDGTYECLYKNKFNIEDENVDELVSFVLAVGNDCYAMKGVEELEFCHISTDGLENIITSSDILAQKSSVIDEYEEKYFTVDNYDGEIVVFEGNQIFLLKDGNLNEIFNDAYSLPALKTVYSLINLIFPVLGGILFAVGLVLLIGDLMSWKITLLSKQLFTTIPIVIVMGIALIVSMSKSTETTYLDLLKKQMVAINEMSVLLFDGDEIAEIKDGSSVDDGTIHSLQEKLYKMAGNNEDAWNSDYSASIYVHNEEEDLAYCIASSYDDYSIFSNYVTITGEQDDHLPEPGSNTTFYVDDYGTYTDEIADTPIYDSEGNVVAYLELSVSTQTMNAKLSDMIKKSMLYLVILLPLFIFALTIIAYINTRNLKRVSTAVSQISNGDFSARIDKYSKDEVGDICLTVNKMAEQLDEFFDQKDKNEKFYYKFVPEKFRELLHKENFTDLALGDAESVDLTVLFCDIRAFSLNSEMMTAKENFEFVNVIYGIAGPIVRAHNGFVDKYIGDAVMALFETADDAVAAGIELYREVVLNPETAKSLQVSSINIGVGIHSGMARIGIVGEDERMSGTVISNTVNLSSRLESLTKRYHAGMLISKETLDRLSDAEAFKTRYLGMIQVAGVNEVKAIYEVLDCLPEDILEARLNSKPQFREALRLYHLGNLEQSAEMLRDIKALPNTDELDPAIEMYLEYIEEEMGKTDITSHIFRFSRK